MNFFKNKKILVTGGTGLIGRPRVKYLVEFGAQVTIVSLDSPTNLADDVSFIPVSYTHLRAHET